ncbi:hypothetical protein BZA05DRAFT_387235 [Tricharina praecox]|uniref:uncharacterized protein n=1 Tax=Tricharina praecox TaxID=43433 RepID=UPI0022202D9D|nr:uncharacterized protein BZA05DRAFT_387235 [Tricharina praecox]KAI5857093.1 hypothetical protein BZA05DRAFT_387235 [Tricharina praecox]
MVTTAFHPRLAVLVSYLSRCQSRFDECIFETNANRWKVGYTPRTRNHLHPHLPASSRSRVSSSIPSMRQYSGIVGEHTMAGSTSIFACTLDIFSSNRGGGGLGSRGYVTSSAFVHRSKFRSIAVLCSRIPSMSSTARNCKLPQWAISAGRFLDR